MSASFDLALFLRYRKARGAERSRLEGLLVSQNEGLTKVVVAQLCGRGENRAGRRAVHGKQRDTDQLDQEEAHSAGQLAMLKALRQYDPNNPEGAGFPYYFANKFRHEIQEAVVHARLVRCPRDTKEDEGKPKGFDFVDGGEEGDRVLEGSEQLGAYKALWTGPDREAAAVPSAPASALADFIARRCEFRPLFRTLRARIVGAYEQHARSLGFPVAVHQLEQRLEERGARARKGTIAGEPESVRYFAGVRVLTIREIYRASLASDAT